MLISAGLFLWRCGFGFRVFLLGCWMGGSEASGEAALGGCGKDCWGKAVAWKTGCLIVGSSELYHSTVMGPNEGDSDRRFWWKIGWGGRRSWWNLPTFADCDRVSGMVRPLNLWELLGDWEYCNSLFRANQQCPLCTANLPDNSYSLFHKGLQNRLPPWQAPAGQGAVWPTHGKTPHPSSWHRFVLP